MLMPADAQRIEASGARKKFRVVLLKPSHYDDDGYVIRWCRSPMPANSLATVYGLIDDCAQRQVSGRRYRHRDRRHRRDQHPGARRRASSRDMRAQRQFRLRRPGRRAVQPISARAAYRQAAARGRHPGRDRRLSRLRHAGDVRRHRRRNCSRRSTWASRCSPARPKAAWTR